MSARCYISNTIALTVSYSPVVTGEFVIPCSKDIVQKSQTVRVVGKFGQKELNS